METLQLYAVGAAVTAFVGLALASALFPRRKADPDWLPRWRTHFGFALINLPLERLVEAAMLAGLYGLVDRYAAGSFGLFHWLGWPWWIEWALAILALDLAVWAQHLATHKVPLFWRFHRVHHADVAFDLTTALRFHPGEIAASMVFKISVAVLLGVALPALVLFELLLAIFPLFNHSNLRLPVWLDRALRLVVVTPDMHRVHHSVHRDEHDNNYGFCFSLWDYLFRTYRALPRDGHASMAIGLDAYKGNAPRRYVWSMKLPFDA